MAYRSSEAYDLSLFEPQVIEQPQKKEPVKEPKRHNAPPNAPRRKAKKKKTLLVKLVRWVLNKAEIKDEREFQAVQINTKVLKTAAFVLVCLSLIAVSVSLSVQDYSVQKQISERQAQIDLARDEHVRLSAQHSSLTAENRVEDLAENALGMVKVDSRQVIYFTRTSGDEITMSGDKIVDSEEEFASKIKTLVAYILK